MRLLPILALGAVILLPCASHSASPYEPSEPAPVGRGVEEIWTDNGVRYYRGLPGAGQGMPRPEPGARTYHPEVEYMSPQPLTAPNAQKAPRKAVSKAKAKPAARKKASAPKKRRAARKAVAAKKPAAPVTPPPLPPRPLDAEPPSAAYGYDVGGPGILGTTRLQ